MNNLSVEICGLRFKNPVIAASGIFGFGREFVDYVDYEKLGGISVKGLTLKPRAGNPPPRIAETPCGALNSVGLQNPGVEAFMRDELPFLRKFNGLVVIANIAGDTTEDYCESVKLLSASSVDAIELNVSCPNIDKGGMSFGIDEKELSSLVNSVRAVCTKPLIVKLSPNVTDISKMAVIAEKCGADAVSLINTLLGMKIDVHTRRPILKKNIGGLSGPAIMPVAVRMTWEVSKAVRIPVIAMGGISGGEDAIEFILAGAAAVMVGTAALVDPNACEKVTDGIRHYCEMYGIASVKELVGALVTW